MNAEHTPGPWKISATFPSIIDAPQATRRIAELYMDHDRERFAANARLIASAPDLLAALEKLVMAEEEYGDQTNAAINEAWAPARMLLEKIKAGL